ncbi:MAG: substrate-binding domain-containing protein [Methanoregulaceae archaeon]
MKGKASVILLALSLAVILSVLIAGCTSQSAGTATPAPTAAPTAVPTGAGTPEVSATTAEATSAMTPVATATVTATSTPFNHASDTLLIATTTSLYDTGLLNKIQDVYQNETGVKVKITSQGTGQAIQLAQRGDVDLLLVHSPSQEKTFMDNGYGVNQRCIAYNYFIIVGPENDPAGIANLSPTAALTKIREAGLNGSQNVYFVSRGDQSGTHTAEQTLWKKAGFNYTANVSDSGAWYLSIGKGMGDTLVMASQKNAYTLTDEGTYLAYKGQLSVVPLVTSGSDLLNRYSAIAVNQAKNPNVNEIQADRFINWLISDEGKTLVGDYGVDKYGKSLFTPLTSDICTVTPFSCTCTGNVIPV